MSDEDFAQEIILENFTGLEKKVSVIGVLKELNKESLKAKLTGKTKSLNLEFEEKEQLKNLKNDDTLRVIGVPKESLSLKVETVHELKDFDFQLFEKVRKAEGK